MKKIISLIFSISFFGSKLFAQCPAGDVPIFLEVTTDQWGYECYWEIVPSGNACGTGTVASGGNTVVGCSGATSNPADPGAYANFVTITEGPFCLTNGSTYDLIFVDSYGDGGTAFDIITNPTVTTNFSGFGGTASFVANGPPAAEAEMISTNTSKYYATNTNLYIEATIKNNGSDPITNIDLTWTDGTNTYTDNVTGLNISTLSTQILTHSIPFNSSMASAYDLDVYISLTGDADNTNDTISATTIGVENPPTRTHVYEEATATWLGWSPRGFVAMKALTSYSNAIPIAVHNGDLMVNSTYDNGIGNYISGYPSGLVNRGAIGETDPGNFVSIHTGGTLLEITPVATTTNIIAWDPSTRIATIEVVGTFHSDLQGVYRLNLIVTEDSIKETSSSYDQQNYYAANGISLPDTDVNGNALDWMNLSNPVAAADINSIFGGYHHVARSIEGGWTGITNSIPTTAINGASYGYLFNVNIDAGWNENNLHFIGWLTETATGEILNASTSSLADSVAMAGPLTVTSSSINETCSNANGSASVTATLGSGSYTYTWSNGGAGSSQLNLIAGTYSVTISDGTDSVVESIIVGLGSTASAMTATNSSTDSDCGLSNGSASITVSGESGTVSYIWNNGGMDATITGITAGTYTVTYTDDAGCPKTETVQVGSSGGFSTNPAPTNVSCFGEASGKVSISVSGAIGNVSYIWNNGATTSVISGLIAGTYFVTATDSAGCVISSNAEVLEPLLLTYISSSTSSTCNNADGSVSATASGGESPYSYLWSNGVMGENNTNIVSGFYTVTIIDNNGCIANGSESITSSSTPITSSASSTNEDCGLNNGVATISASGGVGGFTYLWSNGQSASTAVNLGSGNYGYTVTDAAGCSETGLATVNNNSGFSVSAASNDVTCNGAENGLIIATGIGGTTPYSFDWDTGDSTSAISSLSGGTYTVSVLDATGCQFVLISNISEPESIFIIGTSTDLALSGGNTGAISVVATGGVGGFIYAWSNGENSSSISDLSAAEYTITATDANGCFSVATFTVSEPLGFNTIGNNSSQFNLYPNPSSGVINIEFSGNINDVVTIIVINALGQIVVQNTIDVYGETTTVIDLKNNKPGIYFIRAQGEFIQETKKVVVK